MSAPREGFHRNSVPRESTHLCARCRTPLGKSAIPCPNEPKEDPRD